MNIKAAKYIVIFEKDGTLMGAMTTEGKSFLMAFPFDTETNAKEFGESIHRLLKSTPIIFKRMEIKP